MSKLEFLIHFEIFIHADKEIENGTMRVSLTESFEFCYLNRFVTFSEPYKFNIIRMKEVFLAKLSV